MTTWRLNLEQFSNGFAYWGEDEFRRTEILIPTVDMIV